MHGWTICGRSRSCGSKMARASTKRCMDKLSILSSEWMAGLSFWERRDWSCTAIEKSRVWHGSSHSPPTRAATSEPESLYPMNKASAKLHNKHRHRGSRSLLGGSTTFLRLLARGSSLPSLRAKDRRAPSSAFERPTFSIHVTGIYCLQNLLQLVTRRLFPKPPTLTSLAFGPERRARRPFR